MKSNAIILSQRRQKFPKVLLLVDILADSGSIATIKQEGVFWKWVLQQF